MSYKINSITLEEIQHSNKFKLYWLSTQNKIVEPPQFFVTGGEMFIRKFFKDSSFPEPIQNETQYVKIEGYEHLLQDCQTID